MKRHPGENDRGGFWANRRSQFEQDRKDRQEFLRTKLSEIKSKFQSGTELLPDEIDFWANHDNAAPDEIKLAAEKIRKERFEKLFNL